jgi:acyl dehydratase
VRGTFRVDELKEEDWGRQSTMTATIECEGVEKPVCVAEVIYRYYKL